MKKLLLVLSLVFCVLIGIKTYGVQKYLCNMQFYTPGDTAESYCKANIDADILNGLSKSLGLSESDWAPYKKECLTEWYPEAKKMYSSGQCKPIKEVKYTGSCGEVCTKYNDFSGNTLTSSCTGGNSSCLINKHKKKNEAIERQMKYTHICFDSSVRTSEKGYPVMSYRSISLNPSLTAEQYCEADKAWDENSYKKCISDRNKEMATYKAMNSQGKCYLVKRKSLEYGGVKCTIEYGEKNGEKVRLGTITEGLSEISYKGKKVFSNEEQKEQCIKKLEAQFFPSNTKK